MLQENMILVRDTMTLSSRDETDQRRRERLVQSLSASYGGTALGHALSLPPEFPSNEDPLSTSCFADLCRSSMNTPEDDLMPLDWLQAGDLLKPLEKLQPSDVTVSVQPEKENLRLVPARPVISTPRLPYHPLEHVDTKPPYSFSCLIFMAIEESAEKQLPVKDIYDWIANSFPFYKNNSNMAWRNSVRHNLSLNKCFKKVDKDRGSSFGKGSLWAIDAEYRPNLLQALRKTPYSPYHQLQLSSSSEQQPTNKNMFPSCRTVPLSSRHNSNLPQPNEVDLAAARSLVDFKNSGGHVDDDSDLEAPEFGSSEDQHRRHGSRRSSSPAVYRSTESQVLYAVHSSDHSYSCSSLHKTSDDSETDGGYEFNASSPPDCSHLLRDVPEVELSDVISEISSTDVRSQEQLNDSGISQVKEETQPSRKRRHVSLDKHSSKHVRHVRKHHVPEADDDKKKRNATDEEKERKKRKKKKKRRKQRKHQSLGMNEDLEGANALLWLKKSGGSC